MKIKIIFIVIIVFVLSFVTGCSYDPYESSIYGEKVIDSWFNNVELGKTRLEIENIYEIENKSCEFIEKNDNKYIFLCNIEYKEIGETVIPLSKSKNLKVYAVFILNNDSTYNYKVYNSKYEYGIWLEDKDLNYGG